MYNDHNYCPKIRLFRALYSKTTNWAPLVITIITYIEALAVHALILHRFQCVCPESPLAFFTTYWIIKGYNNALRFAVALHPSFFPIYLCLMCLMPRARLVRICSIYGHCSVYVQRYIFITSIKWDQLCTQVARILLGKGERARHASMLWCSAHICYLLHICASYMMVCGWAARIHKQWQFKHMNIFSNAMYLHLNWCLNIIYSFSLISAT